MSICQKQKLELQELEISERLVNLLITNQIPLAIISNNLLIELTNENTIDFKNLLEHIRLFTLLKVRF